MKQAIIVTNYLRYDYPIRISFLERFLENQGYEVLIVSSDFDHRTKKYFTSSKNNVVLVHTPSYSKNLSLRRIISNFQFALKSAKFVSKTKPNLVYCITPSNFLFKYYSKCKKKMRCDSFKLIFEFEDLWPETLPISKKTAFFLKPFTYLWSRLRDKNYKDADFFVFECNLFREYICQKDKSITEKSQTIYLTKSDEIDSTMSKPTINSSNEINFLYLGSVNNIIDISLIQDLLVRISKHKKTNLHIIGGGEKINSLVSSFAESNVAIINHGMIFSDMEKRDVFLKCDYGLNIMKKNVFVGLTMKSLEYFYFGLPIINTIEGDTHTIVQMYQCGVNVSREELDKTITEIVEQFESISFCQAKVRARKVYDELFSEKAFYKSISKILN